MKGVGPRAGIKEQDAGSGRKALVQAVAEESQVGDLRKVGKVADE